MRAKEIDRDGLLDGPEYGGRCVQGHARSLIYRKVVLLHLVRLSYDLQRIASPPKPIDPN